MQQMTTEQAIAFGESGQWKTMSHEQRAALQLHQDKLCMPFSVFHESIEKALGRPVWTHEFGLNRDGLIAELEGRIGAPTMTEIMRMLPEQRTVVVVKDAEARG